MLDHTDTQVFDSLSQVSTPALGDELKGEKQLQDTVPFDNSNVLDSPLVETHLENLDFDTQVINDSDCFEDERLKSNYGCEKEVVLDSEDEGICTIKTAGTANVSSVGNLSIDEQYGVGSKGCSVSIERTGEQKDVFISSQEPGESSQANALEFVDQLLSLNKMDLSPEIGIKKTFLEKSLPVSSKKQPQSLTKRTKFRKIAISKSEIFDWTDTDQHGKDDVFRKCGKAPFEFAALRQIPVTGDDKAECLNSEGGGSSGNEQEHMKELVNLKKELAVSNQSDPRYFACIAKETCRMEQVSEMNFKNSSVKEFNGLHVESPDQQLDESFTVRDTPDMIDVGFNTQIAAEAMEALLYVPFVGCTALDADQGPSNITDDYPKGVKVGKPQSEHTSIQTSNFSGLRGNGTKSKRSKRTARKSIKNSSNEEPEPGLAMVTKVRRDTSLIGEQFDCTNSSNTRESSGRRSPRLIIQGQVDETVCRNSKQWGNYMGSLISVEQAEGELKNVSTVDQESRQSLAGDILKSSNNQTDNPRDRAEDGITKISRKRSRLVDDPTKVVSATGRRSELLSNSPVEARNTISNQKEQTYRVVTVTTHLKLDTWSHPKGKRALRKGQKCSNGAINMDAAFATVNGKEDSHLHPLEKYPRKSFDEPGSAVVIANSESAGICEGISPAEVDGINFLLCSNGAEKSRKFEVSSGKNLEPPRSGDRSTVNLTKGINAASSCCMPSKYHKKSFNKNLPKSSLLKELIRLGVPESIPDFTWKDKRRRRDMADVRVLFSQHLDDDVIRLQKKISARLRISIATSPLEATHFIADRFVRTRNMLETIALGKPVVTHLWLESCGQASCLIDEKNYILRDAKKEKEIGFSMAVTFACGSQHPLLKGQRVYITPSINPSKEMIISLVKAVQGQVVEISQISTVKDQDLQDDLLILSCEEDHSICVPFLDKGVAAYRSELLLNGIVVQKLEFERHQLFKDHAKRN